MKRILFYYFLIIILLSGQAFGQKQQKKIKIQKSIIESSFGLLKGQVWLGSPSEYAPKVTILIVGNKIKREIISGNGEYSVNLPEGIYSLSTAENFDNYAFKRAKFRIKANQMTYLNLDPPLKISAILSRLDEEGFRDEYIKEPKPYYSRLKLANNNSELDLQIRYFEKKVSGKVTEYKKALVTYDALSVYADKITIDKKNRIVAEGQNVTLESNGQRSHTPWLSLEIKNGKPIIQAANGAIIGIKGNVQFKNGLGSLQLDALRNKTDKIGPNLANTLTFQSIKNNIKFESNYYEIIIETDNEIILEGTGCIRSLDASKLDKKCDPAGFIAKIKDYGEESLENEFSIRISVNSYSFFSKIKSGSVHILKN